MRAPKHCAKGVDDALFNAAFTVHPLCLLTAVPTYQGAKKRDTKSNPLPGSACRQTWPGATLHSGASFGIITRLS
jgi:hypothetical protein